MIRIVLVDDHAMVRSLLGDVIAKTSEMEIVADFGSGEALLEEAGKLSADIVIMDISLPGKDGIETTKYLRKMGDNTPLLCLSMHLNRAIMNRAFKAGANGYAVKHDPFEELQRGIRAVALGQRYVAPALAEKIVDVPVAPEQTLSVLSPRERQVFDLVAKGHTATEIAEELLISERTVDFHRRKIGEKTGLKRIAEIVKFAAETGVNTKL